MSNLIRSTPRVSVVLPTYNQAGFLPEALNSIIAQTWKDYELIVVNDGSTDDTVKVLMEYQQHYGFKAINQENQKLPGALNTGFQIAQGEYLTWTSSDNRMLPNMLQELVDALDKNPKIGLVYADWEVIDNKGNCIGEIKTFDYDILLLMRINYINACFLYRRTCQESMGLYDSRYLSCEDWEYWLRLSRKFKMLRVPKTLYQYRIHAKSLTEVYVRSNINKNTGYKLLEAGLRSRPILWYLSKIKWQWLRIRCGIDPRRKLSLCEGNEKK